MRHVRLSLVLGCVLPVTFVLVPFQYLAIRLELKLANTLPVWWHRFVCRMIGLRVHVLGEISENRPLMIVANHVSWSDIIVLASISDFCFIAKQEVSAIPFAGMLARLQRSVFVKREDRRGSAQQASEITRRLVNGDAMVLFAEGTTGNGNQLLPFKSSLLGAAQYALDVPEVDTVYVQPVSIAYTRFHGIRIGRRERAKVSWPGDLELAPHALSFVQASAWDVEVSFAEAIPLQGKVNRKRIANQTRAAVKAMYLRSVFGRNPV